MHSSSETRSASRMLTPLFSLGLDLLDRFFFEQERGQGVEERGRRFACPDSVLSSPRGCLIRHGGPPYHRTRDSPGMRGKLRSSRVATAEPLAGAVAAMSRS